MRHLFALLVGCMILGGAASAAATTTFSRPPSQVTPYGRLMWNLDALVNDTFDHRKPCFDVQQNNVFAVARGGDCGPTFRYALYTFTFLDAFHSSFRLVARSNPWAGENVAPFTVAHRYVYCGRGRWLGLFHGGGLWPLGCQRP
jgi:hypothetical protein